MYQFLNQYIFLKNIFCVDRQTDTRTGASENNACLASIAGAQIMISLLRIIFLHVHPIFNVFSVHK